MSGMLSALLRGAAGQGLVDLTNRYDRQDAEARAAAARQAALEEERAFRASEAEKDRQARYNGAGARGARGAGGGEGGGGADDAYTVAAIMKKFQVSEAKARALLESGRLDQNPFQADAQVTEQIDDGDRTRNVTRTQMQPDPKRWAELNQTIAEAMIAGPSMAKSNYEQLEGGRSKALQNTVTSGMLAGKIAPNVAAEGIAAMSGKGAYGQGGVNEFTGTADAVGRSSIAENLAQAGSANRANPDDLAKLPPAVKTAYTGLQKEADQITAAITSSQAAGNWDPASNKSQSDLQVRLRVVQDKAQSLLKPYLPGKADADEQAVRDLLTGKVPPPKASQSDARKAEPENAPAPAAPAAPKTPGLLDRIGSAAGGALESLRGAMDIKATLERRIAEAKAGGTPLTPGEKQLAQKYGMTA